MQMLQNPKPGGYYQTAWIFIDTRTRTTTGYGGTRREDGRAENGGIENETRKSRYACI